MEQVEYTNIDSIVVHKVGNKTNEDSIVFSNSCLEVDENLEQILSVYFLSHFKPDEQYHFHHDTDLNLNETYSFISAIFDNPESLFEQSKNLAKHLYNQSTHPKIKGGEFYVTYFMNYIHNGERSDAIGLFKSENKDTFLEIEYILDNYEIGSKDGININKLDKGCLIFNSKKEDGYCISVVDNTNKTTEAQYWRDDFLGVLITNNDFNQTNQFLGITKQFLTKQISEDFEVTKADQIDLLNKSVDFFKNNETFEKEKFEQEVFQDNQVIESFRSFDDSYRNNNEIELSDNFEISSQAVKKQARAFKSVLKLDKNFHIYIHGDKELIEQGVDENGRKYYKIYYENEA